MGYLTTLRENIENEMRIRGNFYKVQNVLFVGYTDHNSVIYVVKGNNNKLLAVAEAENGNILKLFL